MVQTPGVVANDAPAPLEAFRTIPVHVLVYPAVLRDQLKLIFTTLKFTHVTFHTCSSRFLKSAQDLALILRSLREGLVLVGPPMEVVNTGAGTPPPPKEIREFFSIVSMLLTRAKRDPLKCLPLCVPIFEDIEFIHKREGILLQLAEYGVSGAFILKKQDTLGGLSPKRKQMLMKEQVLERYMEIRDYLAEYLPHRQSKLEALVEKKEEHQLSERKSEAENWIKQAEDFKAAGNYERSIQCYKKAIELYPADPKAYLESGKVYVRLHKYPKALRRFRQAEEVAANLPEPNKEIGRVRILQVRERIAKGEPANSPEITRLLEDAVDNFGNALVKAESVSYTSNNASKEKNINAVMSIAGEIIKMDAASTLGDNHPLVRKLSTLARESLLLIKGNDINDLPAKQLIFMGQTDLDSGDFQAAEKRFYKAAKDMTCYHEAINEIIFMGHFVRRRKGPEAAIGIYQRLLDHNPPDKAAVYFNLAVAFSDAKRSVEAAQSIIRGIYIRPEMAQDQHFYKSPSLHPILRFLMEFYGELTNFQKDSISNSEMYAVLLHEKLLVAILSKNMAQSAQYMLQTAQKMPVLFKRQDVLADTALMTGLQWLLQGLKKARTPMPPKLIPFTEKVLAIHARYTAPDELLAFRSELSRFYQSLIAAKNLDFTAALLTTTALNHPKLCRKAQLGAGTMMRNFAADVRKRLVFVDVTKLT